MDIQKLFNTLKYLKLIQLKYRLYYLLKKKLRKTRLLPRKSLNSADLKFIDFIHSSMKIEEKGFIFLNKKKIFEGNVNWNFKGYGKLWVYNLNYFDLLNQKDLKKEKGLELIYDFIGSIENIDDGLDPYPTSLRGINWIKFLSLHKIKDKRINDSLYAQYYMLLNNLEYHLLGNHLLENGFSLLFGAYYFRDEILYKKAKEILLSELNEQILPDGGHFEQSPMYHQVLLERLLDSINLIKNNDWIGYELLDLFKDKAEFMLSWIENITFSNGNIPLFNDSAFNLAPTTQELMEYARRLNITYKRVPLKESGYRLIRKEKYEIAIDVANVKASYIPGHTHADTFTFELYVNGEPIIVDTGTSTYENNERRLYERSTRAHNTVEIENTNSSEVWGSFRLGERAKVIDLYESSDYIKAIHDGYLKKFKALHCREFVLKDDEVIIIDNILGNKNVNARFYLHFHPDIEIHLDKISNKVAINGNNVIIEIDGPNINGISLDRYFYAPEFNKLISSKVLVVPFKGELICRIKIKN